jgi:hypothetical protein
MRAHVAAHDLGKTSLALQGFTFTEPFLFGKSLPHAAMVAFKGAEAHLPVHTKTYIKKS